MFICRGFPGTVIGHALAPLFGNWPHLHGSLQSRQSADNGRVRLGWPIDAKVRVLMTNQDIIIMLVYELITIRFVESSYACFK